MSDYQENLARFISQLSKDPTGFNTPENVTIDYDSTARTVTLGGTVNAYYKGTSYDSLVPAWVSDPHTDADGIYFLTYNGTDIAWRDPATVDFYDLLVEIAIYKTNFKFGLRECHGFMPWPTHLELHDIIGTYRKSGGEIGAYTLSSTTVADRRPSVDAALLHDEDLPSLLPILSAEGTYSQFTLTSTDTANISTTPVDIVPLLTNQPYFNEFTGGAWQQTLMSNNFRMSIWLVAVPTTSDSNSQKYRFLWVQGQEQSLSLEGEQLLSPFNVSLGEFTGLIPEFVFIGRVIIRYQAADWHLEYVESITGTKNNQTQSPSTSEHNSTTGKQGGTTDEYYHLVAADYGNLTDANAQLADLHTDGSPEFSDIAIPNATGGDLVSVGVATDTSSPRITLVSENSGFAAPSTTDNNSLGDKWVFWNSSAYKGAIGFDTRTMWFQSTENTVTDNNRFKFFAGSAGSPIELLTMGNGNVGFSWNSTGADTNFNVATNGVADALFIDGANGEVTLGQLTAGVVQADSNGKLTSSAISAFSIVVVNISSSRTALLTDAFKVVEMDTSGGDRIYTLPQDSEVAFNVGDWIEIRSTGSNELTIAKGTGATFRGIAGDVNMKLSAADGVSGFAEKTAANTWLISGSVLAA